jgi:hypothetical protein
MGNRVTLNHLSERELATVLACLRLGIERHDELKEMPHFYATCEPLKPHEIDTLCERLNTTDEGYETECGCNACIRMETT